MVVRKRFPSRPTTSRHRSRRPTLVAMALAGALAAPVPAVADEEGDIPDGLVPEEETVLTDAQREKLREVRQEIEVAALRSDDAFLDEVQSLFEEYPALADPIAGHAMEMKPSLTPGIIQILEGTREPSAQPPPTSAPWERPWEGAVPDPDRSAGEAERPDRPAERRFERREPDPPERERALSIGVGYVYGRASTSERFGSRSVRYRLEDTAIDLQYAFTDHVALGVTYFESDSVEARTNGEGGYETLDGQWRSTDVSLRLGSNLRTSGLFGYMGFGLHRDELNVEGEDRVSGRGFHAIAGAGYAWGALETRLEAQGRSLSSDFARDAGDDFNGTRSGSVRLAGSVRLRF